MSDERLEEYFSRLGATFDMAADLAAHWGEIDAFLAASFEDRLLAVVDSRQASIIVDAYDDFEHMRDTGGARKFRRLEGVGVTSAMRVDYAYIRRTIFTPRDVITAEELARKMGLAVALPERAGDGQERLDRWVSENS